jgi:hypothetical protein
MFADVGYLGVDVGLRVAEDESVVDVYDDICIDAIEEAISEGGHQKYLLVVNVE